MPKPFLKISSFGYNSYYLLPPLSAGSLIYTTLSQFPELVAELVDFSYKIIFLLYQTHYLFLTAFSHSLTSKVPVLYHPPFSSGKR
jgi:hypothetical protein